MRKVWLFFITAALLTLLCAAALADPYSFSGPSFSLDVPRDPFTVQLTQEMLEANEKALTEHGLTLDTARQSFSEGTLLMAFDDAKKRTLTVTAVRDDMGISLYDINEQTAQTRATYRVNHSNGSILGSRYKIESCEWKNFGDKQGRFLMIKYTLRGENNKVAARGLIRRTIRNGYTITLDLRVADRQVSAADITVLNKVQNTVSFSVLSAEAAGELTLGFTAPPPATTESATFTVKGTTRAGATVLVVYASLRNKTKIYTTTASAQGTFSVEVKLPSEDLYNVVITAIDHEGTPQEESVERTFSVDYDAGLIPISFTSDFPTVFTEDSFKYSGTTLTGVTIQMVVNGKNTTRKTGNAKSFSFTVDTSKPGAYEIQVSFTKKNYDTRIFSYTIQREMDENQKKAYAKKEAAAPAYANLVKKLSSYVGKTVHYKGYITEAKQHGSENVLYFALEKSGKTYNKFLAVVTTQDIAGFETGKACQLYGTVTGMYQEYVDGVKDIAYPQVSLLFFE